MIGICTWPGQVQKREKTDRTKTVYTNGNNIYIASMHQALSLDLKEASPPPSPLPPQTIGVHHLAVSPCCTDQAITFFVSGGYISHTGHFLRQQRSGDCCPTVSFSLFFLLKRKPLLLKLTHAEPGTSIHWRAVRKGWSIANLFFLQCLHQGVL